MPIKCAVLEDNITADPDDYAGMVQISGRADGDDLVPNLVDGTYPGAPGEVRARMGGGTSARELRIGRLDATLTVLPT